MDKKPATIDEYISAFPEATRRALQQVREAIIQAAPDAEETISYNMLTFKYGKKYLVHFAGYKNHIGFYALATDTPEFVEDFAKFKKSKAAIQFALSDPMPIDLIKRVIRFNMGKLPSL